MDKEFNTLKNTCILALQKKIAIDYNIEKDNLYVRRLDAELDIINRFNYAETLLLLVRLKEKIEVGGGIVIPGNGCISLFIAYLLNISPINPVKYQFQIEPILENNDRLELEIFIPARFYINILTYFRDKCGKKIRRFYELENEDIKGFFLTSGKERIKSASETDYFFYSNLLLLEGEDNAKGAVIIPGILSASYSDIDTSIPRFKMGVIEKRLVFPTLGNSDFLNKRIPILDFNNEFIFDNIPLNEELWGSHKKINSLEDLIFFSSLSDENYYIGGELFLKREKLWTNYEISQFFVHTFGLPLFIDDVKNALKTITSLPIDTIEQVLESMEGKTGDFKQVDFLWGFIMGRGINSVDTETFIKYLLKHMKKSVVDKVSAIQKSILHYAKSATEFYEKSHKSS